MGTESDSPTGELERYSREGIMAQVEKRLDGLRVTDALPLLRSAEKLGIKLDQEKRLGLVRHASGLFADQLGGLLNTNNQRGHLDLREVVEGIACLRLAQVTKETGTDDSIHLVDEKDTANILLTAIGVENPSIAIISDRLAQTKRVLDRLVSP